ncbi:MAG: glycosyltransferase family 2 protein [Candidatus Marinimicrobia bacterium]|nr:glycosyltransferase family 2 protein [Candidatus Neomarinimicrobiota bacterium]
MILLTILQIIGIVILGGFLSYLAILSLLAVGERNSLRTESAKQRKFAIVVPAYNEEQVIAGTLRGLYSLDYDDDKYEVLTIADNCTDNTAMIAKQIGAKVYERHDAQHRGKGYALRWAFNTILEGDADYDAIVVVDADSTVSPNMLKVMNKYMDKGAKVVQGYLTVPVKPGSWTSEIIRIGFTLYNYVRPLGRRALGLPTGLRGNGMCFSVDVLQRVPWTAYSQTEDLEYGLSLLLNDIDVVFAPEAIGYNTIPENPENAETQRERWEIGRMPSVKRFGKRLLQEAWSRRAFKLFDAFIHLVTPPLVNMVGVTGIMIGLNFVLWSVGILSTFTFGWIWTGILGIALFHALVGFYAAGADPTLYQSLLYVPKYFLWKLKIYGKVLIKGASPEWVRTARE